VSLGSKSSSTTKHKKTPNKGKSLKARVQKLELKNKIQSSPPNKELKKYQSKKINEKRQGA